MPHPSLPYFDLAQRVLHLGRVQGSQTQKTGAGQVYETFFDVITPVLGAAGARALLARSVKLTGVLFPALAGVLVAADILEGKAQAGERLLEGLGRLEPDLAGEITTALFATLFGLMANLIGDSLVQQMIKRAFPALDLPKTKEKA